MLVAEVLPNTWSVLLKTGRPTFSACGFFCTWGLWGRRGRWKCQHVCVDAAFGCHPSACFSVRFRMWHLDSEPLPPGTCWGDQSIRQHPETPRAPAAKSWQLWATGRTRLAHGLPWLGDGPRADNRAPGNSPLPPGPSPAALVLPAGRLPVRAQAHLEPRPHASTLVAARGYQHSVSLPVRRAGQPAVEGSI